MNYSLQISCPSTSSFLWIYLPIAVSYISPRSHFKRTHVYRSRFNSHSYGVYCERINTKNRSICNTNIIKTLSKYCRSTFISNARFWQMQLFASRFVYEVEVCSFDFHVRFRFLHLFWFRWTTVVRCMCSVHMILVSELTRKPLPSILQDPKCKQSIYGVWDFLFPSMLCTATGAWHIYSFRTHRTKMTKIRKYKPNIKQLHVRWYCIAMFQSYWNIINHFDWMHFWDQFFDQTPFNTWIQLLRANL